MSKRSIIAARQLRRKRREGLRPGAVCQALALACLLSWTSLSIAGIDQAPLYVHTPFVCIGYLVGIALGLVSSLRRSLALPTGGAVALGTASAIANAIAAVSPLAGLESALLALSSAACGLLVMREAHVLVTIEKMRAMPLIAIGGILSSAALALPALSTQATALGLAAFPLLFAVFSRAADELCGTLRSREDPEEQPAKDTQHTIWPLPCAVLACAIISSIFTSLLAYPFMLSTGNSSLYSCAFGICIFSAMWIWSAFGHRRNVNGFVIVAVLMLEISLLAFSTGIVQQVHIPVYLAVATQHVLAVLFWVLATYLSRNEHTSIPYSGAFALFVGCGSGALGHVIGYLLDRGIDFPFSGLQVAGAVLMASFAVILIVFFSVEMLVMRSNLEQSHASDMASVKDEAAREVEEIKTKATLQIASIWSITAQQVEEARTEAAQQVVEIQKRASHEAARRAHELSMHESCRVLADRFGLTQRELELMQLVCDGMSRNDIAEQLLLSQNTVKYHMRNLYRKLDVRNSRELIAYVDDTRIELE